MRSPGVIYRRYRQYKKKILFERAAKAKNREHENCVYGKELTYKDRNGIDRHIRACMYTGVVEGSFEVCDNPCECSAFANRWTREDIESQVEAELGEFEIKNEKYPEIAVLEWVLDKDYFDAIQNPGILTKTVVGMIMFLEQFLKVIGRKNQSK